MFDWTGRVALVPGAGRGVAGVLYLVSDEAEWVNGHSLVINGGGTR